MAKGNPARQKMINMMYLVLTALLALNVSKEVLLSFFKINSGIERTTSSIEDKNNTTYLAFEQAAINDPVKFEETNEKVKEIKSKSDELFMFIQEMKYLLVKEADGIVYLGDKFSLIDEDGKFVQDKAVSSKDNPKNFEDLTENQKRLPIAELKAKSDRYASQDLFLKDGNLTHKQNGKIENMIAFQLSSKIKEIGKFYTSLSNGNQDLKSTINIVCNVDTVVRSDGKKDSWEINNFQDMLIC